MTEGSLPTGHAREVLGRMKRLGMEDLLSRRRGRERDLVPGMIAKRVLQPCLRALGAHTQTK